MEKYYRILYHVNGIGGSLRRCSALDPFYGKNAPSGVTSPSSTSSQAVRHRLRHVRHVEMIDIGAAASPRAGSAKSNTANGER